LVDGGGGGSSAMSSEAGDWFHFGKLGWIGEIAGNSFGYERSQFQIGKCWNCLQIRQLEFLVAGAAVSTKVPVWHSK
jgi:hypothetical protein